MNTNWQFPSKHICLENKHVRIDAVKFPDDLLPLYEAASFEANNHDLFRYHVNMPVMSEISLFEEYLQKKIASHSEVAYKIFSKRLNSIVGCTSLMNVQKQHGVIEVGSIWYSKAAQKTEINTNAMYLLFCYVFDELRYRRLEWKCNNLNDDSKRAALRLGFTYEGLFRQHMVSRDENRDTAWYSIIDTEWNEKKKQLEQKLA